MGTLCSTCQNPILGRNGSPYCCAVVWMHGLGDTEHGWASTIQEHLTPSPSAGRCRFVFPRAPVKAVSCNSGWRMTSWFDMKRLPIGASSNPPRHGCSLEQAEVEAIRLRSIIDKLQEDDNIPPERIIIGGFSQGGAMALHTALTYPQRIGACIVFSGVLIGRDKLADMKKDGAQDLEVFWGHGANDNVLEQSLQDAGAKALREFGIKVTTKVYPMAHSWHDQEMQDARAFLDAHLPPASEVWAK